MCFIFLIFTIIIPVKLEIKRNYVIKFRDISAIVCPPIVQKQNSFSSNIRHRMYVVILFCGLNLYRSAALSFPLINIFFRKKLKGLKFLRTRSRRSVECLVCVFVQSDYFSLSSPVSVWARCLNVPARPPPSALLGPAKKLWFAILPEPPAISACLGGGREVGCLSSSGPNTFCWCIIFTFPLRKKRWK